MSSGRWKVTLDQVIAQLERGQHVVLEFGRQRNLLAYILAATVIYPPAARVVGQEDRALLEHQGRGRSAAAIDDHD